ncbi:MAG: AMP-binding protein [Gleimia sp.]|jgi:long-chain acyl-CoA synthetase|nr:AMP-binding protein [Acidobacteriota bacterium]
MATITKMARAHYEKGVPYEIAVPDTSLYLILEESAQFYADRPAIDYFGETLTYGELKDMVDRAAQVLRLAGVRRGDSVAIALPNCPQHVIVFYALMRIGAVASEHNPLAPKSEIDHQVKRHKGRVAVVWEKVVNKFDFGPGQPIETMFTVDITYHMPKSKRALLALPIAPAKKTRSQMRSETPSGTLSWDRKVRSAEPLDPTTPHATGDDIAVILHTGGTNGVPKSVPLTHRNIGANANQNLAWVYRLHEGAESFFSLLPYFHSFGLTFFMVCAIKLAASQVILPKFDVDLSLEAQKKTPVTFFVGVPPMFDRIARRAKETGVDISSIRYAISGAMPLPRETAEFWEEMTGGYIIEGYGMTETAPTMCGSPMTPERRHGALGLPFPSTLMRLGDLADPNKEPEPGEPGEILVKGPQVFSGYLDAPEDNADAFTEDGYFRTGDIGVCDDGFVYLSDRRKELILSGGFNVYPSQVEAAIRTMPGVKDVAVVGLPTEKGEEVTAALVLDDGVNGLSLEDVRAWAEKRISHYALPRSLAIVSELPYSQIGKVMRRVVRENLLKDPRSKK